MFLVSAAVKQFQEVAFEKAFLVESSEETIGQMKTLQQWREYHFSVEREYAQQILESEKHSAQRARLFEAGYDVITRIINEYDRGGGETHYTETVAGIITKLLPRGSRVCDVGCATGNLVVELLQRGYVANGIDVSGELVENANNRLHRLGLEAVAERSDILSYCTDRRFDCIVMDNVIEHFHPDSVADVLKKCHSLLAKTGYVVILTPHSLSGPHDISRHFSRTGCKARGFHLREFSFTDLNDELIRAGYRAVLGFPFHPRLFGAHLIPGCSRWASKKALVAEAVLRCNAISALVRLNSTFARATVALLCPSVCVAVK